MKNWRLGSLLLAMLLLTGCASLLEREYVTTEPHSSKFWESEAADILRAENYQDIVNDLLILIGQHTETATLRLYNFEDDLKVADTLERAAVEIQQETPLGAYAVEFITSTSHAQRGYHEITLRIGYRRTAEQTQALVNATSPEAVYSLLDSALDTGRDELAVRIGYWGADGQETVENAMRQLREERGLTESKPWIVNYYPETNVGLLEFLLDPPESMLPVTPVEEDVSGETDAAEVGETEDGALTESAETTPEGSLEEMAEEPSVDELEPGAKKKNEKNEKTS